MSFKAKIGKRPFLLGAGVLSGVVASALVISPVATSTAGAEPIAIQAPFGAPMSFADLIDRVSPAVVSVQVTTHVDASDQYAEMFERFRGLPGFEDFLDRHGGDDEEDRSREGRSLGSGFFISSDGHIVTNNHVIENAAEIIVTMSNGDELEAELIGADPETDLAVLKVTRPNNYDYVAFNVENRPRVGDWVVAVGNPFGLAQTATAGIVSADGRELGGNYNDFIQIDASINQGNSGGPTFDLNGNVIGVNTQIISPTGGSVGIGFAIEAKAAKQITDILIRDGKVTRGWLGVTIQTVDDEAAEAYGLGNDTRGAFVTEVTSGSPAEDAGIKRSDIILEVNGAKVKSSRDLTQRVGSLIAGSENEFVVYRDGGTQTINVTVGIRPTNVNDVLGRDEDEGDSVSPNRRSGESYYGMSLTRVDPDTIRALGLKSDDKGLVVQRIDRDSAFADAGLLQGDVILEAQGEILENPADLETAVNEATAKGRENLLLAIRRGRNTAFITVEIAALEGN